MASAQRWFFSTDRHGRGGPILCVSQEITVGIHGPTKWPVCAADNLSVPCKEYDTATQSYCYHGDDGCFGAFYSSDAEAVFPGVLFSLKNDASRFLIRS